MPLISTKIKMLKCLDMYPNKHKWKSLLLGDSSEGSRTREFLSLLACYKKLLTVHNEIIDVLVL